MKAVLSSLLLLLCACAKLEQLAESLDSGGVERIEGNFQKEVLSKDKFKGIPPTRIEKTRANKIFYVYHLPAEDRLIGHAVAMGYYFYTDLPRFIRYLKLRTDEPVKNIDIYVRNGSENWKLVRQLKSPVHSQSHIDINKRANAIRVVQKTVSWDRRDIVTDIEVYAQKK